MPENRGTGECSSPCFRAIPSYMETLVFSVMILTLLVVLAVDTRQKRSRYLNGDEPDARSDHR